MPFYLLSRNASEDEAIPYQRAFVRCRDLNTSQGLSSISGAFIDPQDHQERRLGLKKTSLGLSYWAGNFTGGEIMMTDGWWDKALADEKEIYLREKQRKADKAAASAKAQALANDEKAKAEQECAAKKALQEAKALKCNYEILKISGISSETAKTLDISAKAVLPEGLVELLGGERNTHREIEMKPAGAMVGPCNVHKGFTFDFVPTAATVRKITMNDSGLKFVLKSTLPHNWFDYTRQHLMLHHPPAKQTVVLKRCGHTETVTFAVYPNIEFKLSVKVKFPDKRLKGKDAEANPNDWMPISNFKQSYDGEDSDFGTNVRNVLKKVEEVKTVADNINSWVKQSFGEALAIDLIWPTLSFEGSWGYDENKKTHRVERKGSIKLSAEPLVGVKFSADLLSTAAAAIGIPPAVQKLPIWVKKVTRNAAEVKVSLVVSLTVDVRISWEYDLVGQSEYKIVMPFELAVVLTAEAGIDAKYFMVKASIGGKGSAKLIFGFTFKEIFPFKGDFKVKFDGATVEFYGEIEGGVWIFKSKKEFKDVYPLFDPRDIWQHSIGGGE